MSCASDTSDCGFEASSTGEPASIKAGLDDSQDQVDDVEKTAPPGDHGPVSISLIRISSEKMKNIYAMEDSAPSADPEPASISVPLSRGPSQDIKKSSQAEEGTASRIAQLDPLRPVDDNFVLSPSGISNSNTPVDEV